MPKEIPTLNFEQIKECEKLEKKIKELERKIDAAKSNKENRELAEELNRIRFEYQKKYGAKRIS